MAGNNHLTYDQHRLLRREKGGFIRFFTPFTSIDMEDRADGLVKAGYLEKAHNGFWFLEYKLTPEGKAVIGSYEF